MFCMLIIAFSCNTIARALRIAAHLHVFFSNRLRGTAQLYVWAVGIEHFIVRASAATRVAPIIVVIVVAIAVTIIVIFVLAGAHKIIIHVNDPSSWKSAGARNELALCR
jgi:hypothetical protein